MTWRSVPAQRCTSSATRTARCAGLACSIRWWAPTAKSPRPRPAHRRSPHRRRPPRNKNTIAPSVVLDACVARPRGASTRTAAACAHATTSRRWLPDAGPRGCSPPPRPRINGARSLASSTAALPRAGARIASPQAGSRSGMHDPAGGRFAHMPSGRPRFRPQPSGSERRRARGQTPPALRAKRSPVASQDGPLQAVAKM
jgi:hypothetical protein